MKSPSKDRYILVCKAVDTRVEIWASQPSDCHLLQRDHVQCASVNDLMVRFANPSMHDINGPAHPETLEDWQSAIQHLLSTYQPHRVNMSFGDLRPSMQQEFSLNVTEGETYTGLMARNQDMLFLFR